MSKLRSVLPFSLYIVLLLVSFYPQSLSPLDTVAYIGDALEAVWVLAWNVHQFFLHPTRIFDANILYPHSKALTYTDHRIGTSLMVAPVIWATGNPILAYNVAVALGCLLAAYAGRRFASSLGISPIGAWAAGALYGFHTYQVNEGPRIHILFHGFLPLALEQLIRYLKTAKTRHAFQTAGWMLLQGLCSSYHVLYGAFLLGIVALAFLVAQPAAVLRRVPMLLVSAVIAAVLFLPIILPYLASARAHGFRHEMPAGVDLEHYVSTTPTNVLYGAIGAPVRLQQQAPHFVGFVSLGLCGLTLVAWGLRRGDEPVEALLPVRVWVPGAAAMAMLLVALSLGKDAVVFGRHLGPGPYRLLYEWIPGFQQVRIPERLGLLAMFFVALLVGRALTLIESWQMKGVATVLAALVPLEHVSPLPITDRLPVKNEVPAVYRWIDENPVAALAEVPIHGERLIRKESLEMYFSFYHDFTPIIHGYESYPPLLTSLLRKMVADFPSEASLQALERVGVDTVIVHHGRPDERNLYGRLAERVLSGRLVLKARFAGEKAHVYGGTMDEVYWISPGAPIDGAPFPAGRRRLDPGWHYRTKVGNPAPAADEDLDTAWKVSRPLNGDEFFEVTFPRPLRISGLVMRLRRDSRFPDRFKIAGREPNGQWIPLTWFDDRHQLQLLASLLADPGRASVGFDLGGKELTGLMIMVEGPSFLGWSIPEIEVWSKDAD